MALSEQHGTPRHPLFGEQGGPECHPRFVAELVALAPLARRVALATACTLPWSTNGETVPPCYQRDLDRALAEAREDPTAYGAIDQAVTDLLASVPQHPIDAQLLAEIIPRGPMSRHQRLIMALNLSRHYWDPPEQWLGLPEDQHDWLDREFIWARQMKNDEWTAHRKTRAEGNQ